MHQRLMKSVGEARIRPRIFRARHRMSRHEMHALGQMRLDLRDDRGLDRARHRRRCSRASERGAHGLAPRRRRRRPARKGSRGPRPARPRRRSLVDLVGDPELANPLDAPPRSRRRRRCVRARLMLPRGAGERRADQAEADDRDALEERLAPAADRDAQAWRPPSGNRAERRDHEAGSPPRRRPSGAGRSAGRRHRPGAGSGRGSTGTRPRPSRSCPLPAGNGSAGSCRRSASP